ncbi:hypothetical protein FHS67_005048 [Aminobacter aminovorans]|uniref:Uncharacterized protein n=1 Tax=Aminobacter aminovorans TaxID=83263 RepID=A0AAC8YW33_AMIAI|nr:hypothetical protein AA2016_6610 [Aminobacter aminovorans]MBB3708708.1 hypothetical protein [Aminobacter aminovorans]
MKATRRHAAQGLRPRIVRFGWSTLALSDRAGIFTYITAHNPAASIHRHPESDGC